MAQLITLSLVMIVMQDLCYLYSYWYWRGKGKVDKGIGRFVILFITCHGTNTRPSCVTCTPTNVEDTR